MPRISFLLAFVGSLVLGAESPAAENGPFALRPLVVILDGAGDLKGCSTAISRAVTMHRIPVDVEVFSWSHGQYKIYKDQVDEKHSRSKGKELAERLLQWKREQPERPIVLVSYSAGCAVGLAAGGHLPPETLERHIVLAPSVSPRYDLRPSLRASRKGIDAFCSSGDKWALGVAVRLFKSADELRDREAAGRNGFRTVVDVAEDDALYTKLRQHFWMPADAKLGHDGRHHGMHSAAWLEQNVLPLLVMH